MFGEDPDAQEIRMAFVPLKTDKGDAILGVAMAPGENMIAGVMIMEGPENLIPLGSAFLSQFQGLTYSPKAVAQPQGALDQARKKAKDGDPLLSAIRGMKELIIRMQDKSDATTDMKRRTPSAVLGIEYSIPATSGNPSPLSAISTVT